MASSNPIHDEPINEINVPVMQPYLDEKYEESVRNSKIKFADWMLSRHLSRSRKNVDERVGKLKKEMREKLALYEKEAPMRGFLKTYRIDGEEGYDQIAFINHIRPKVIRFLSEKKKPFQVKFILTCRFRKGVSDAEEMVYNFGYFHSGVEKIMEVTNLDEIYGVMTGICLERISKFQNKGSGWQFDRVEFFDMHVDPFKPLRGSSYFKLPKKLAAKKAIINVKNENDNECFKWAVTSAVYPREGHPERLNGEMRKNSEKIDWAGIDFPTPLNQIERFEKQNPYSINVYGWDGGSIYPLRISEHENERSISLLLLTNNDNQHYCWIKNESALIASQVNKHKGKVYLFKYCCNSRPSEETLEEHQEYCSKHKAVREEMPLKGTMLAFGNYCRKMQIPFVVYADFEAITESISTCSPNDADSYTKQYQKHTPCGFSYLIKCFNDELFPPRQRWYTCCRTKLAVIY